MTKNNSFAKSDPQQKHPQQNNPTAHSVTNMEKKQTDESDRQTMSCMTLALKCKFNHNLHIFKQVHTVKF